MYVGDRLLRELARHAGERGARIAIDDAGAGYAGLKQVMWVRPDIVKLDLELTRAIHWDPCAWHWSNRWSASPGASARPSAQREWRASTTSRSSPTWTSPAARASPSAAQHRPGARSHRPPPRPAAARWPRLARSSPGVDAPTISAGDRRLEHLSARLANARSRTDLYSALDLIAGELHADKVSLSQWHAGMGVIETLAESGKQPHGEFFPVDEYPTTSRVLEREEAVQVMVGDPRSDRAEVELTVPAGDPNPADGPSRPPRGEPRNRRGDVPRGASLDPDGDQPGPDTASSTSWRR